MADTLKIGMIGGGKDSFMGEIHRRAIKKCGCIELVSGAFGSNRNSSYETGRALNLQANRVYGTYRDFFRREAFLPPEERVDFVSIVTSNAMHYPISMSALDAHFPIFCEKPFTCNIDEALNLMRKMTANQVPFGVAMVYPAYPALRKAKAMLEEKALGTIRKVVVEYRLGWMAPRIENAGNRQALWRSDPRRGGPAGCLADLASHCFYLAEWLTGLSVVDLTSDMRPTVPGRVIDDDCTVLARFNNGVRGYFLASQIETGAADGLSFQIYGDRAAMLWKQIDPGVIRLRAVDGSVTSIGESVPPPTPFCPPTPFGNNEAYVDALAKSYLSFAAFAKAGKIINPDPGLDFVSPPEGLRMVAFVDAVLKNNADAQINPNDDTPPPPPPKWQSLEVPPVNDL